MMSIKWRRPTKVLRRKRKRRRLANASSVSESNHNRRQPANAPSTNNRKGQGPTDLDFLTHVPVPELAELGLPSANCPPVTDFTMTQIDDGMNGDLTPALRQLSEKMDIFQKEQSEKKS